MILGDWRWGDTEAERTATFSQARLWTGGLTFLGAATLVWSVIFPHPYGLVMGLLMALPVLALYPLVRFRGLVRFNGSPRSPYPDVVRPCLLPAVGLFYRDFRDVRLFEWKPLVIPLLGLGLVILAVLWVCSRDVRARSSRLAFAALFAFIYSLGAVIHVNAKYEWADGTGLFGARWENRRNAPAEQVH